MMMHGPTNVKSKGQCLGPFFIINFNIISSVLPFLTNLFDKSIDVRNGITVFCSNLAEKGAAKLECWELHINPYPANVENIVSS